MTATQNGWRVIDRAECVTIDIPGGQVPVHPRLAVIFADLGRHWHDTVAPLVWPGCWGYALRPIKGSTAYSNHSSGTAVDLSAPELPQGVAPHILLTARELTAIGKLEERYGGVLDWGGRWPNPDAMHWEVAPGTSVEAVDALAATLAGPAPAPAPALGRPVPAPKPAPSGFTGPDLRGTAFALRGEQGNNGPRVAALQEFFRTRYPAYAKALTVDGWWGPKTSGAVREFAQRSGVRTSDGLNIGPQLARKLYLAGARP